MPTIGLFSAASDPKVFAEPNGWTEAVAVTIQYGIGGPEAVGQSGQDRRHLIRGRQVSRRR